MANDVVAIGDEAKSQRPSGSAFKQQKLPAWQPILTAGTVLPTFFLIGVAFIPIGVGLLVSSNQVQEHIIDYTFCMSETDPGIRCADLVSKSPGTKCTCHIQFELPDDFKRDVYIYYGMSNYYQNHRRYVKSRDDRQLLGYLKREVSSECKPYDYIRGNVSSPVPIAPCGAIANSMFNDTFVLEWKDNESHARQVPLTQTAIAWATDKNAKFKNPSGVKDLKQAFKGFAKPPNWNKNIWELDKSNETDNNGFRNEPFIVWMRTAALPTFRKIYARVAHDKTDGKVVYSSHLPKGNYTLTVAYNYPVMSFKGSKKFIISNTSWLGGKNPFLGITYMFVGCICLVLTLVFAIIHKKYGKSTNELLDRKSVV